MMKSRTFAAVALAAALALMTPSYAWGDAVQASPLRAQDAEHQAMIDEAIALAQNVPVDATSFEPYESAATVLRGQMETMGLGALNPVDEVVDTVAATGLGLSSSGSALRSALYELAEARGEDTSALATWEPWQMPEELDVAMARVISISADIETSMRAAVEELSFEDVQDLQEYLSALQAAYESKDISDLVDNDDFRNSPILQIPAGEALWNAVLDLAADSVRLTEAAETVYELLKDPEVVASVDFSSAAVDPTGNIEVDDDTAGDPTGHRTLYIDLGGDSSYTGFHACGTALGLAGFIATDPAPVPRAASTYLDMGGDDEHLAILCGTGGGTLGVGILMDAAGDDLYLTGAIGQGGALGGVGVQVDEGGDDIYGTLGIGQGAAAVGAGVLTDSQGDDIYVGLLIAQGAGVGTLILADAAGAGVMADGSGEDIFGSITFAQGFGMINGHGAAVHVDGDDLFILANPIGQLAPAVGQGAGFDLGTGVLAGGAGDDTYAAASLAVLVDPINALALAQGYGGDAGTGTFADLDGSDYTLLLAGAGDVAFGGSTGDSSATASGQGMGEREGVGVYFDPSPNNVHVGDVDPDAPDAPTVATSSDGDGRFLAAIAANVALSLGEVAEAGDAVAKASGQGSGTERGMGVLYSGPGNAANSLVADAIAGAGAAGFDADFGFDFDAAFDICLDIDFQATFGSFANAFAFCDADARADASDDSHAYASAEAIAGDAIAESHGQGFGGQNGIGILIDEDGSDTYEQTANSFPVALAVGVSISVTLTLGLAVANANAIAASIGLDVDAAFGQYAFAFASQTAYARAVSISYAEAEASSVATAASEAVAMVGDAVTRTAGQGAGVLNGFGALVDGGGPDAFKMDSLSKPIGISGAVAASAAVALAASAAVSLTFATALASALAVAVGVAVAFDYDVDVAVGVGGGSFLATATAIAIAIAAAIAIAFANAFALAAAGAGTESIATAIANALASASASGSSAISLGETIAETMGQGFGMLNGAGLLLRTGQRVHVDSVDAPDAPANPAQGELDWVLSNPALAALGSVPTVSPDVQPILDDAVAAANDKADKAQGDVVSMKATSEPSVAALSGTIAIAFAEALAAALAAGIAAAGAVAAGVGGAAAAAAAIAAAGAAAAALCLSISFGVAACLAIAAAAAVAIAAAAAISAAAAQAISASLGTAISLSIALSHAKESAAAASAASAALGPVTASTNGQGSGLLNGLGAMTGGSGDDVTSAVADADVSGIVAALAFAPFDGACASAASMSVGGIDASALGQGYGQTSGTGALVDTGGDDVYRLAADAGHSVATIVSLADLGVDPGDEDENVQGDESCGDGASSSAVAVNFGTVSEATGGQAAGDGNSALIDLGGSDSYSSAGRADNTVATGGGIVMGTIPGSVFADVAAEETAEATVATAEAEAGAAAATAAAAACSAGACL